MTLKTEKGQKSRGGKNALQDDYTHFSMLAAIVESSDDAIISKDLNGVITTWNPGAEAVFGYTAEEAIGRPVTMLMPPDRVNEEPSILARIRSGEKIDHYETVRRRKDGKFINISLTVSPIRDRESQIIGASKVARDVTAQKRTERRNGFTLELDERIRTIEDPEQIALELSSLLGTYLGVDRCFYAEVEEDEDHFYIPDGYIRDPETTNIVGRFAMSQFGSEALRRMRVNEPFIVDDVSSDPLVMESDRASYELAQIQAIVCVPLQKKGRFVSFMAAYHRTPRKWAEEEVDLVRFVANRFWESVERAGLIKSLKHAVSREQVARAAAEKSSRVKDDFLATVSHELRTPLNAILGWASLLRSGKLSDAAEARAFETLYNNARAQAQLIDDLLDVSRIITGKLRLDVQAVEMSGVIESAVESLRPAAESKGIRLQLIIDPHTGPISGDPARLQQVLWNLLSNSMKYTPKGGRVYVKLERVNSHIELSVSDTGIGIEPSFLPHIFERFVQEGLPPEPGRAGLGLGLSIAKNLVELHGGQVKAESEGHGKGATFTVLLPRLPVLQQSPPPGESREHPITSATFISIDSAPDLQGLRVLVVDDEPDARELVREVLELCGAAVRTRTTAAEAMEELMQSGYDILVSDIGMPEEDGYSLMERVRLLPEGGSIPAVALTAYARVEDRVRALRAGFQTHLPKPIEPVELAAVVASLTGRA